MCIQYNNMCAIQFTSTLRVYLKKLSFKNTNNTMLDEQLKWYKNQNKAHIVISVLGELLEIM